MFKKLLFTVSMFTVQSSFSITIEPVFSGNWYVHGQAEMMDNCSQDYFNYSYFGNDETSLAIQYTEAFRPPIEGCTWIVSNIQSSPMQPVPVDFPGGDLNMWNQILGQNGTDDNLVNTECVTAGKVEETFFVVLYPQYVCPSGSRATDSLDCNTTPVVCNGDIVGRNLDNIILGPLGHVAITYSQVTPTPDNEVYEVLNNDKTGDPLVQENSFDSFKVASSSYWGDKYGLQKIPVFSMSQGKQITSDAAEQMELADGNNSSTYTMLPIFTPGGVTINFVFDRETQRWEKQLTPSNIKFRCDTFVDWIYSQALGVMPLSFEKTSFPYDHLLIGFILKH